MSILKQGSKIKWRQQMITRVPSFYFDVMTRVPSFYFDDVIEGIVLSLRMRLNIYVILILTNSGRIVNSYEHLKTGVKIKWRQQMITRVPSFYFDMMTRVPSFYFDDVIFDFWVWKSKIGWLKKVKKSFLGMKIENWVSSKKSKKSFLGMKIENWVSKK